MLDTADIIAAAESRTGLNAPRQDILYTGLNTYVDSLNREAPLHEQGEQRLRSTLVDTLSNRLRIDDYLRRHPELLERPVEKPLFVFGLPRTGTTLTINLFNADPARRCFLRWESLDSVPPPTPEELHNGPRFEKIQSQTELTLEYAPQIAAIHYEDADSPTECQFNMIHTFCAQVLEAFAEVPGYRRWFLHQANYLPVFHFHKRLLQLLQAKAGGKWTLKNPWHPLFLNELTTVYPDARLVMTHRDPADVVASCCSLIKHVRTMYSDQVDLQYIGESMVETFEEMIRRTLAYKEKHGRGSIYDLHYDDLMRDPVGEIRNVCDYLDEPLSGEAEAAMKKMLANNPKNRFGKHEYSLEEYGLTREAIHDRFSGYCKAFNIALRD